MADTATKPPSRASGPTLRKTSRRRRRTGRSGKRCGCRRHDGRRGLHACPSRARPPSANRWPGPRPDARTIRCVPCPVPVAVDRFCFHCGLAGRICNPAAMPPYIRATPPENADDDGTGPFPRSRLGPGKSGEPKIWRACPPSGSGRKPRYGGAVRQDGRFLAHACRRDQHHRQAACTLAGVAALAI